MPQLPETAYVTLSDAIHFLAFGRTFSQDDVWREYLATDADVAQLPDSSFLLSAEASLAAKKNRTPEENARLTRVRQALAFEAFSVQEMDEAQSRLFRSHGEGSVTLRGYLKDEPQRNRQGPPPIPREYFAKSRTAYLWLDEIGPNLSDANGQLDFEALRRDASFCEVVVLRADVERLAGVPRPRKPAVTARELDAWFRAHVSSVDKRLIDGSLSRPPSREAVEAEAKAHFAGRELTRDDIRETAKHFPYLVARKLGAAGRKRP